MSADYESVACRAGTKETCADMDRETVVSSLFELAVRGEKMAQQRLHEVEADVVVKHWEKRNSDTAFYETHQEFESQRLQLQQTNQLADQAQRDKIACVEHWNWGIDSSEKNKQKIDKKLEN